MHTYFLTYEYSRCFFFFFQAEDGIRDLIVTGVQTCALPIWRRHHAVVVAAQPDVVDAGRVGRRLDVPETAGGTGRARLVRRGPGPAHLAQRDRKSVV